MRVENEWRDAKGEDREPEVQEEGRPDGHGGVEEEQKVPHAHVDAGSSKARVEDREGDTGCRETTPCRNVPGTTERQVTQDGL